MASFYCLVNLLVSLNLFLPVPTCHLLTSWLLSSIHCLISSSSPHVVTLFWVNSGSIWMPLTALASLFLTSCDFHFHSSSVITSLGISWTLYHLNYNISPLSNTFHFLSLLILSLPTHLLYIVVFNPGCMRESFGKLFKNSDI